jgi:hypothetical protein
MHAWFSKQAAKLSGSVTYSTEDGKEVETTAVYESIEQGNNNYHWDDKIYVGVVKEFLRLNAATIGLE